MILHGQVGKADSGDMAANCTAACLVSGPGNVSHQELCPEGAIESADNCTLC